VRRMEDYAAQPDKILTEVPAFLSQLRTAMDRATGASAKTATGATR